MNRTLHSFTLEYLREAPLFAAIVRGVECMLLQEAGTLESPLLDLGCGDGVFAGIALTERPDIAVDPSLPALLEARARHAAHSFCLGDATRLPFPDDSFRTIVSNSVLEHIPDVDAAVAECSRLLAPGGRLIVTSPSEQFGELLAGTRIVSALGLRRAAAAYTRWFNGHSLHFHTDSPDTWQGRLERNGLRITRKFYYLTPGSHFVFDLLHYLSVPRLVRRRLTGRWAPRRDTWSNRIWNRWIVSLTKNSWPSSTGPYVYIDAIKE